MKWDKRKVNKIVKAAVAQLGPNGARPRDDDNLVFTLGFDSVRIASLALALEGQFNQPLLLNGWIGQCHDPAQLTVSSLCDYLHEILEGS